jgi:poly-gamma-glutamate capsule biosynthesis protein CapA/YwtB (metallophosphatase superfamily)
MKYAILILAALCLFILSLQAQTARLVMIEDFEDGSVNLTSYSNEDIAPSAWSLDQTYTYNSSLYALKLSGNTWKQQTITPFPISVDDVLQVAMRNSGTNARIQGIGFSNGTHTLFYSIDGTATLNIEQWVTVYQGAFGTNAWNLYQFPIADDWWAYFDEVPILTSIIYVNDLDTGSGSTWFDNICTLTTEIPDAPQVTVLFNIGNFTSASNQQRFVTVYFYSNVTDPDSDTFTYQWDFGDSTYSFEANPVHTYTVTDDHPYTVLLRVTDDTGRWGLGHCTVNVDAGPGSLPITMNFVGDIMLARAYEQAGGIIPTLGVNAIFQPTKYLLGDAADITSANLEVVLTDTGTAHPTKSVVYRGDPENVNGLVYAGIDIVSLANNHVLDYDLPGLQQMRDSLEAKGIIFSGAGANSYEAYTPAFINSNGLNIAFLRNCDRTGQYNNAQPYLHAGYNKPGFALFTPYYLSEQLEAVEEVSDLRIVEMHGGSEYSVSPGSGYDKNLPFADEVEEEEYELYTDVPHMWDIAIRHYAVDSGADLVIVHHPHIIHGMEIYNGKLIAHSLGNFAFDLSYPETMPTIILYADADFSGFSNYQVVPVYIDRYIPRRATAKLGLRILDYLAKRSRDLNTYLLINKDDITASVIVDSTSISFTPTVTNLQSNLSPTGTDTNITVPIMLKRRGSISSVNYISPGSGWQARLGQDCLWWGNMEDEGASMFSMNGTTETYDSVYVHEGNRSLKITVNTSAENVPVRNKMKWYDNTKKYTLNAWIRTRSASAVNIDIQYFNSRTATNPVSTESMLTTAISGNNDWIYYSKEITIPPSCSYYVIVLRAGGGMAWFDEVGLIEWTAWQDISMLQNIPHPNDYYWLQIIGTENPKSIMINYTEKEINGGRAAVQNPGSTGIVSMLSNYPNPFNPETTISFNLGQETDLELSLYNIKGQKVNTLVKEYLDRGRHSFVWKGTDKENNPVSSGVYFYRIKTSDSSITRKIILIK